MVDDQLKRAKLNSAFKQLIDGDPAAFSAAMIAYPITFATIVLAFLGVLIRERFGTEPARSELAGYAKSLHRSRAADGCPPVWVVETALRVSAGEVWLLEEEQSEEFYEAVGLVVRSLLRELDLSGEAKNKVLLEANEIVREALLVVEGEHQ